MLYQFAHSNLSQNILFLSSTASLDKEYYYSPRELKTSSRETHLILQGKILTQKLGDDRPLLIQREHVIGQVVVMSQCPQSMGQLEQTLTAASTAVPAREWARGTVLQAHPCKISTDRLLIPPSSSNERDRLLFDKMKEDEALVFRFSPSLENVYNEK